MYTQLTFLKNHLNIPSFTKDSSRYAAFLLESHELLDEQLVLLLSCFSQKYTYTRWFSITLSKAAAATGLKSTAKSLLCRQPEHQDTNHESILRHVEISL